MIATCLYLAKKLHCSIDYILDKEIVWVERVLEEQAKAEVEDIIYQLVLHGASKKFVRKIRSRLENSLDTGKKKKKTKPIPVAQFGMMGLQIGRDNKTRVVR